MDSAAYEELKKLLEEFYAERDVLLKKIDENNTSIREVDYHTESILNKDDGDSKLFSPRTAESLYREELEQLEKKKVEYQQQNNLLFHDRNRINSIIEILEKIIRNERGLSNNLTILKIQEEERQRIARDLHDTSLQNLAHLVHKIELSSLFIDQDIARAKLELAVVSRNLRDIINDIRNAIFDLRPMAFDDLGLKTAFERLFSQLNFQRKFELDLHIEDVSCENDVIMLTIYRIVQESLINICKHAEADKIYFCCRQEDNICVIDIEDNGKGFILEKMEQREGKHFGLSLIRERVHLLKGKFEITSKMNVGTKIRIQIPLS